jgi:hypothetical protein
MDQLMVGVLCASAVHGNARLVTVFFRSRALWLWLPFAAIMMLSTLRFRGYDLPWHLASSATAYLTAAMILHQSARPLTGDYEPLATLGRISYSIYLVHAVIFDFVSWHLFPPALQMPVRDRIGRAGRDGDLSMDRDAIDPLVQTEGRPGCNPAVLAASATAVADRGWRSPACGPKATPCDVGAMCGNGQITPSSQAPFAKIFLFFRNPNQSYMTPHPIPSHPIPSRPDQGRRPSSPAWDGDAVDASGAR